MRFSIKLKEIINMLVSAVILGFLFSLNDLNNFVPNIIIVGIAFIAHELTHKLIAEHFDCKAEYVLWPQAIMASIIIAFLSRGNLIIAALGYVNISTYYATRLGFRFQNLSLEEIGKISLAGPSANIVVGLISALIAGDNPFMLMSASLNFQLALFNLLPVPPLDGSKVLIWSRMTWLSMIVTTGVTYTLTLLVNPILAGVIGLITMGIMLVVTFIKDL